MWTRPEDGNDLCTRYFVLFNEVINELPKVAFSSSSMSPHVRCQTRVRSECSLECVTLDDEKSNVDKNLADTTSLFSTQTNRTILGEPCPVFRVWTLQISSIDVRVYGVQLNRTLHQSNSVET